MTEETGDQLNEMLKEGWAVTGYSVCMLARGMLAHNILLQKDHGLQSLTIVSEKSKELGRTMHTFSPKPEAKKKGFFG